MADCRIRVALVGCGKAAENHVSQIQHIPDVKLHIVVNDMGDVVHVQTS